MGYKDPIKQKEAQREFYLRNKTKIVSKNSLRRQKLKAWFREYTKDFSCLKCGESDNSCLDFHHLDPDVKEEPVSHLLRSNRSTKVIIAEINKCIVLCANCHRKFHAGVIQL